MQTTNASKMRTSTQSTRERILYAARKLFMSKGFHAATTAELATMSGVSIGLIYRHFTSKDDIVLAVGELQLEEHNVRVKAIFDGVKRGDLSIFDAIKAFAFERLADLEGSIFFEVLAESYRNRLIAERMRDLMETYRESIRYLTVLARPNASPDELDSYVDLATACFTGIGYRPAVGIVDAEKTSYEIARLLMLVFSLPEPPQPEVISKTEQRSLPRHKSKPIQ